VRRGFTLIELIIVIALITLAGGLIVVNARAILSGLGEEPVERTLQKAIREARYKAASLKEPTLLRYDEDTGMLEIFSETGAELATFKTTSGERFPEIEFEQILPEEGLGGGSRAAFAPIDRIVFRPDRSSTPFKVTITEDSSFFSLHYDPFSAIVVHDSRNP
jgi:prepilin-type N-terminal cleavage/methylation domain-containing protein